MPFDTNPKKVKEDKSSLPPFTTARVVEEILDRGVEKIYPSKLALKKLLGSKKIKLYQGFDPSMPNLHLGNLVGILKLKQFQELGHKVIFLVGDFTGMIGDPTDKISVRKKLSREQVLKNAANWRKQIERFLDFLGKNPAKIMFNSRWNDKINFKDLIEITSNFTVQKMLERDFFQERIKTGKPIFLHEFLYPVAQAIDCVQMDVDLEIGGSDQTFNMLVGRDLMRTLKDKEKFVLTTKLLIDKEGRKVGKTTGGAIFLNIPPNEMFGAIMTFPDEVISLGFELLTTVSLPLIKKYERLLKEKRINPNELKKILALEITKLNYGERAAKEALEEFERVFKKKQLPSQIPTIKIPEEKMKILEFLVKVKLAPSKSEAKRLILQKAVKIDDQLKEDWREILKIKKGIVIRVGKRRFAKII